MLSTKLLTPETSAVAILDYQPHVLAGLRSGDPALIELNTKALARISKVLEVPVLLSTIGVNMRGDQPTIPSIREELADQSELDRTTMNAWEDEGFRKAVDATGRKRLVFAAVWTEVCLLQPVLHAQREGWETYFVVDAVGGSTVTAHETAIQRLIQAGSQPVTLNSLVTEWIRDWATAPNLEGVTNYFEWYGKQAEAVYSAQADRDLVPA